MRNGRQTQVNMTKIMDELNVLTKEELLQVLQLLQINNSKAEADLYDILAMIRVNKRARGRAQRLFALLTAQRLRRIAYLQATSCLQSVFVYLVFTFNQGHLLIFIQSQRGYTRKHDLHEVTGFIITYYTVSPHPSLFVQRMFISYTITHRFTTHNESSTSGKGVGQTASVRRAN